ATVAATAPASGTPTGTVTFTDTTSGTTLGTANVDTTGKATFSTTGLGIGTHTITASYAGTGNFAPSNGSVNQNGTARGGGRRQGRSSPTTANDAAARGLVTPRAAAFVFVGAGSGKRNGPSEPGSDGPFGCPCRSQAAGRARVAAPLGHRVGSAAGG